ncbi:MAG: tRNA (N6-isopentenyl adenosine(37)-C2)-methylthiotransferase MiaB [Ignavibacteria bacterium]|nr:tRNA (N6-isopentenyl adenosine(37)-C2)-methylthiotransferase MiaB [Ignavibacteria bacterium]MBI3765523.1 tRNA (N6-isopentenyl adenosine(37)-C2)-methylthiotransferase MiaB [Ignavibacteriales bacterium]
MRKKRVYIETYGCQMNAADSEVVLSLLAQDGYEVTNTLVDADVVLANTCSVRENAEQRIYGRLGEFKRLKNSRPDVLIGLIGCMAERLRTKLTAEKAKGVGQIVDMIVGPDEYRRMPELVHRAWHGEKGIAVQLSRVETYDDIVPLRTSGISAWISVMRGCDKFCSFCVVPFTRGRERSRTLASVVREVEILSSRGFKEVTLLGQNVNSYRDENRDFADLLRSVAEVDSSIRIRFTTSHPQDMSDKLIETIADHTNICKFIHLPVQSGSDRILELMNRTYDRARYLGLLYRIRTRIPDVSLSTDIITGFPSETEDDHQKTMELMEHVRYDGAFTFKYSPRENTPAFKMLDDVPDAIKTLRINEIIDQQQKISLQKNQEMVNHTYEVLVESESKKSPVEWQGRTDGNKMVVFPKGNFKAGDYITVKILRANSATLFGSTEKSHSQIELPIEEAA